MCGITGIVKLGGLLYEPIHEMTEALTHRGPDGQGTLRDEYAAFGHRRLSIIDLSETGRQPLTNEDGTIMLTFNGEIYDYNLLRKRLEKLGHKFKSQTDSEVLVHLFE